ncbi:MAG: PG0541 family transporter-associated protein [Armatimonadota bacterium]
MKLAIIIIDEGCEPDVAEVFEELGVEHWTSWANVHGAGRTGTKQGNPIWPGLNTLYLVALPQERLKPLVDRLIEVRDSFPMRPGLKVLSLDADVLT